MAKGRFKHFLLMPQFLQIPFLAGEHPKIQTTHSVMSCFFMLFQ